MARPQRFTVADYDAIVRWYLGKGMMRPEITNQKIADRFNELNNDNLTMQAVYNRGMESDLEDPRSTVRRMYWPIPRLPQRVTESTIFKSLSLHMRFITQDRFPDLTLSEDACGRLRWFYNDLAENNLIAVYDPSIVETTRSKYGRFDYSDRKESDEDLILRWHPSFTLELTDELRDIWALPEPEDWP